MIKKKFHSSLLASIILGVMSCTSIPNNPEKSINFNNNIPKQSFADLIKVKTPGITVASSPEELLEKLHQKGVSLSESDFSLSQTEPDVQESISVTKKGNKYSVTITTKHDTSRMFVQPPKDGDGLGEALGGRYRGAIYIHKETQANPNSDVIEFDFTPIETIRLSSDVPEEEADYCTPYTDSYNPYAGCFRYEYQQNSKYRFLLQSYSFNERLFTENRASWIPLPTQSFAHECFDYAFEFNESFEDEVWAAPSLGINYSRPRASVWYSYWREYDEGTFLERTSIDYQCSVRFNNPFVHIFVVNLITPNIPDTEESVFINSEIADGEDTYEVSEAVFSPRDKNEQYDQVNIDISVPDEQDEWQLVVQELKGDGTVQFPSVIENEDLTLFEGMGSQEVTWDGFNKGICLRDGHYELLVTKKGADPENLTDSDIYQQESFFVDNTPPIIQDVNLTENPVNIENDEYTTTVSFNITDPTIDLSSLSLNPGKPSALYDASKPFNSEDLKDVFTVALQDATFGTPVLDEDGFWITNDNSEQVNHQDMTFVEKSSGTVEVSFTIPYRVSQKSIEVSLNDRIGNKGTYILNDSAEQTNEEENS